MQGCFATPPSLIRRSTTSPPSSQEHRPEPHHSSTSPAPPPPPKHNEPPTPRTPSPALECRVPRAVRPRRPPRRDQLPPPAPVPPPRQQPHLIGQYSARCLTPHNHHPPKTYSRRHVPRPPCVENERYSVRQPPGCDATMVSRGSAE